MHVIMLGTSDGEEVRRQGCTDRCTLVGRTQTPTAPTLKLATDVVLDKTGATWEFGTIPAPSLHQVSQAI